MFKFGRKPVPAKFVGETDRRKWDVREQAAYNSAVAKARELQKFARPDGRLDRDSVAMAIADRRAPVKSLGMRQNGGRESYSHVIICEDMHLTGPMKGKLRGFSMKFASENDADATGYSWESFGDSCEFEVER